jgi:hypothetical protein
VEPRFAVELAWRRQNRQEGRAGSGESDYGCSGPIALMQGDDAGGTVPFEFAAVVRVHEGADEERGEESTKSYERQRSLAKRSAMREKTHHRRA